MSTAIAYNCCKANEKFARCADFRRIASIGHKKLSIVSCVDDIPGMAKVLATVLLDVMWRTRTPGIKVPFHIIAEHMYRLFPEHVRHVYTGQYIGQLLKKTDLFGVVTPGREEVSIIFLTEKGENLYKTLYGEELYVSGSVKEFRSNSRASAPYGSLEAIFLIFTNSNIEFKTTHPQPSSVTESSPVAGPKLRLLSRKFPDRPPDGPLPEAGDGLPASADLAKRRNDLAVAWINPDPPVEARRYGPPLRIVEEPTAPFALPHVDKPLWLADLEKWTTERELFDG